MRTRLTTYGYRAAKRIVRLLPASLVRFRPFRIYEMPLNDGTRSRKPSDLKCHVAWISSSDEGAVLKHLAAAHNVAAVDGTITRAVAAWVDDRAVGCAWVTRKTFLECELGLEFELKSNEAWLYAAVVEVRHRNRGIYGQILQFLIDELRQEGVERILLGVAFGNEPSRRAHARQGASHISSIFALRSMGISCCVRRGQFTRPLTQIIKWGQPIKLVRSS
jgi:GNAT superfamily N-acetyltransferase